MAPAGHNTGMAQRPAYSQAEYRADRAVHVAGLLVAPIAVAVLVLVVLLAGHRPLTAFGVTVYGAALLTMLTCSALYNLLPGSPRSEWLRRCDHAAIYAMIAGTYTPFTLLWLPPAWGWLFCAAVWSVAAVGIAIKLAWPRRLERLSVALYLALGWSILLVIGPIAAALTVEGIMLLIAGGVLYSVGVVFHLWRRLRYQNAIWHGLVLAAAACHFAAIAVGLSDPAGPMAG